MTVDERLVLEKGHLFSKEFEHDAQLLEWLDRYSQSNDDPTFMWTTPVDESCQCST